MGRAEAVGAARRSRTGGQPTCRHLSPARDSQVAERGGLRLGTSRNGSNAKGEGSSPLEREGVEAVQCR